MTKCSGHECRKLRATTCSSCGWNKEEVIVSSSDSREQLNNYKIKTIINQNNSKMSNQTTFTPTELQKVSQWAKNWLENPDVEKAANGNKAAGVRVRKDLQNISGLAFAARKEVTAIKKLS